MEWKEEMYEELRRQAAEERAEFEKEPERKLKEWAQKAEDLGKSAAQSTHKAQTGISKDGIKSVTEKVTAKGIDLHTREGSEKGVSKENTLTFWYNKGNEMARLGRFDEAIKCYDKALEKSSTYSWAWVGKGQALFELSRFEEAITCFDKTLQYFIHPESSPVIEALYPKGIALEKLGRTQEAIRVFRELIEMEPRGFSKIEPSVWRILSRLEKK